MNPIWAADVLIPLLLALFAFGLYAAWRSSASTYPTLRAGLVGLRAAALCLFALIALNPGQWLVPDREDESEWIILLDRSGSMDVDDGRGESRWAAAVRAARIAREHDEQPDRVQVYTFSDRLERRWDRPADLTRATPDAESTDILTSLNDALDVYERSRRPLDGILLLTDGRQVAAPSGPDPALRARALGAPIYALPLGGDVARRDLAVTHVRRHFIGFAGQSLRVQARLLNEHLGDIRPEIRLLDAEGAVVAATPVHLPDNAEAMAEFEIVRAQPGYAEYEIVAPDWPGESTSANNRVRIGVTMLEERIRILMVEGIPHWDSKFLLQLLRAQPHMRVTTVHRVTGERFFLTEAEAMDEAEERAVFPSDVAGMNVYDLVIFGKGAEYFLNADRVRLLRHFVEERGGAVLFARGKPYAGTFRELEPLEPIDWGTLVRRPFRWRPTVAADASGLFGALLPARTDERWERIPPAELAYRQRRLKPFTQVLVEGVFAEGAAEGPVPILATRRLGKGLSAVVNAEDIWRWDFFPTDAGVSDMYKQFWTLLVQWMAIQSDFLPGQAYAIQLSHAAAQPDTAVKATVRMRDADAAPETPPLLRARRGDEVARTWRPRPVAEGAREWVAVFALDAPGVYRIEAMDEGATNAAAYATLEILEPPHERMDVSADPDFLDRLTSVSGGRTLSEEELNMVAERFRPERHAAEVAEPVWRTRWDRAWLAVLMIGFLSTEWFLRRRNGMM